jgi:hypothetical protein
VQTNNSSHADCNSVLAHGLSPSAKKQPLRHKTSIDGNLTSACRHVHTVPASIQRVDNLVVATLHALLTSLLVLKYCRPNTHQARASNLSQDTFVQSGPMTASSGTAGILIQLTPCCKSAHVTVTLFAS